MKKVFLFSLLAVASALLAGGVALYAGNDSGESPALTVELDPQEYPFEPVGGVPNCPGAESSCNSTCNHGCGPPNLPALQCTDTQLTKCRTSSGQLVNCGPSGTVKKNTAPCITCPCPPGEICPDPCGSLVRFDCDCLSGQGGP